MPDGALLLSLCLLCPGFPSCFLCWRIFLARTQLFWCVFGYRCVAKLRGPAPAACSFPALFALLWVIPAPCLGCESNRNSSAQSNVNSALLHPLLWLRFPVEHTEMGQSPQPCVVLARCFPPALLLSLLPSPAPSLVCIQPSTSPGKHPSTSLPEPLLLLPLCQQ